MYEKDFVIQPGVYGGWTLICRRCKGITYTPLDVMTDMGVFPAMQTHVLWCPGVLEDVLAYFAGRVKRDDGAAGTVGTEGK